MSLTISPQAFAAGFNPKAYPIVPPSKQIPPGSGANTNSASAGVRVDLSHLEIIKIIPEMETTEGNNLYSYKGLTKGKTGLNIQANSDELVEKIINPETGEEV